MAMASLRDCKSIGVCMLQPTMREHCTAVQRSIVVEMYA
jgi:hypothetical protein